jgi:hypothetical protein
MIDINDFVQSRLTATQEAVRIVQRAVGDVNWGIHDEDMRMLFDLKLPTFLPGVILGYIAALRDLSYVREDIDTEGADASKFTIEGIVSNFNGGIEIQNRQTPQLVMLASIDHDRAPIITADNSFVMFSDYATLEDLSEDGHISQDQLVRKIKCTAAVKLTNELDDVKLDLDSNGHIVNVGEIDYQGPALEKFVETLNSLAGSDMGCRDVAPLFLSGYFAHVFTDLLLDPEKAGHYKEGFEYIGNKLRFSTASKQELAELVSGTVKADYSRIADNYIVDGNLIFPIRRLPFYTAQKLTVYRGIEDVCSGSTCQLFLDAGEGTDGMKRSEFSMTLIGATPTDEGNLRKVFETTMDLKYMPVRGTGFSKLNDRLEAYRADQLKQDTATEASPE